MRRREHLDTPTAPVRQLMQNIERYLMSCSELTTLCSQNGWIDTGTLRYEIIEENDRQVIAFVQFDEVIVDIVGRTEERIACQGHLCLALDHYGQVEHAELL